MHMTGWSEKWACCTNDDDLRVKRLDKTRKYSGVQMNKNWHGWCILCLPTFSPKPGEEAMCYLISILNSADLYVFDSDAWFLLWTMMVWRFNCEDASVVSFICCLEIYTLYKIMVSWRPYRLEIQIFLDTIIRILFIVIRQHDMAAILQCTNMITLNLRDTHLWLKQSFHISSLWFTVK